MFNIILQNLPQEPYDQSNGLIRYHRVWSCGDEILCRTDAMADAIADLLEAMGYDGVNTGYYDPDEDEAAGEVDRLTGWYYVSV